jgi:phosphonate transport system permease protein
MNTQIQTHKLRSKPLHISIDRIIGCVGAICVIAGYFLPWLRNDAFTLSGYHLSLNGYPYLFILPLLGSIALSLVLKNQLGRPLTYLAVSSAGFFLILLLTSMVLNYDTGPLVFYHSEKIGSYVEFHHGQEIIIFDSFRDMSLGLYISLAGWLILYFSQSVRSRATLPRQAKLSEEQCRIEKPVNSLEDLRPSWTLDREYKTGFMWLICLVVLVFTFTWCGMSPLKLWENRKNAKEYLLGRALTDTDWAYIHDQAERAAQIEAQGRAREFQDNKYRGVPFEEQPTLTEKFKENEALVKNFLAEMSVEEKRVLGEKAYRNALDEKKGGYFPPETAWPKIKGYLIALLETVAIAIWGTLLAVVCAVPVSLLAATNTLELIFSGENRWSRLMRWLSIFVVRRFLDACRGFNEFVMALIFVAVIGLGPFAGILALWIHTFGILGKVFSEQIEAIEGGQIEALSSTGAAVDQTIAFSVLPQVMPGFVSYTLLRFESNVRSAAILGFVGAGGIGFLIFDKLNGYLFREVCTMMIIIIIAVGIIDYLCGKLRKRFI